MRIGSTVGVITHGRTVTKTIIRRCNRRSKRTIRIDRARCLESESIRTLLDLVIGRNRTLLKVISPDVMVFDFVRAESFGEEIEWWKFVPRRSDFLFHDHRLVVVHFETDIACTVVSKVSRDRSFSDLVTVNIDRRAGRIAVDGHTPTQTPAGRQNRQAEDETTDLSECEWIFGR